MLKKLIIIVTLLLALPTLAAALPPSGGSASCKYCHNDGIPTGGGETGCGGCHVNPPHTGAHLTHTDGSGSVYGSDSNGSAAAYRFNCGNCHSLDPTMHGNGSVEVELYNASASGFKKNNPATAASTGTGDGTVCLNIYCHSSGQPEAVNTYAATPLWGGGFSGNRCAGCHSYPPDYANNAPKANSHVPHEFNCDTCHAGTTADGTIITNAAMHVNHNYDVTPGPGVTFTYTYAADGGTCTNISCHGNTDATWGGTAVCTACHGSPPPQAAAGYSGVEETVSPHMKHAGDGTNYGFACSQCHKGNKHGNGTFQDVFLDKSGIIAGPSASYATATRTCSSLYCHSPGNKSSAPLDPPKQAAVWGSGTLGCNGCHAATPPSGSHARHVATTYGVPVPCYKCHSATVNSAAAISSTANHVNKMVDVAFDVTAAINGRYSSNTTPMQKPPGSGYGNCENVYCHSNGQNEGGTWPPTYSAPRWGNSATGKCGSCHKHGYHGGDEPISSGSHGKHLNHGLTTSGAIMCTVCHYGNGFADPYCTVCHFASDSLTTKHINMQVDVDFISKFGGTYNGSPTPGSGYGNCSGTYCHSNGASVATGSVPANMSPNWGSGPMTCNGCHSNPPAYANGSPKANSHAIHAAHSITDCSICHYGTTNTGATISDSTKHVNKVYNVEPKPGYTFTYTFNSAGGSCSNISCHGDAQWGASGAGGVECVACHGHSPGYEYEAGKLSQGRGSWKSHATHTQADGGNVKGPNIGCDGCHDTSNFPYFKSGTDADGDGKITLSETDACNVCHSPGGDYDGVNNTAIGAKNNWKDGVYDGDLLKGGKEKWCAGCHDGAPAVIGGVSAPNVIGQENGTYSYGVGWGYYKTGHGLSSSGSYPASGGLADGAGAVCSDCHTLSTPHIDGTARTYVYNAVTGAANDYQNGYRLKSVNGGLPMMLPRNNSCTNGVKASDFNLCMGCHDSDAFINSSSTRTNFRNSNTGVNAHYFHLAVKYGCGPGPKFISDWKEHAYDSQVSCVTCHNVHGSTQLSMVRDGKLVSREPGLQVAYNGPGVSYLCAGPSPYPPTPADLTLDRSTGTVWNANVGNVCGGCHGSCGFNASYPRTPFDQTPPKIDRVYGTEGGTVLAVVFSEGVYSNQGKTGALVPADFVLNDSNNGRSIIAVTHTAGESFATLALSSPLDLVNDIGRVSLAAAPSAIFDGYDNAMGETAVALDADVSPPEIADLSPGNGSVSVSVTSGISLSLTDSGSGVDLTQFSIGIAGDKGYSKSYSAADTSVVSTTGTPAGYVITVNPDENFNNGELITVTVNGRDLTGNPLTPPSWSFTTQDVSTPETMILHPSSAAFAGGFTASGGGWDTVLDSNDGLTSRAGKCGGCGYPCDANSRFIVDMDDSGLVSGAIQNLEIGVVAKYAPSCPTSGTSTALMEICYKTGTNTVCTEKTVSGDLSVYTASHITDSDGGALDIADIDNMQIEIRREGTGSINLIATEVFARVTYVP